MVVHLSGSPRALGRCYRRPLSDDTEEESVAAEMEDAVNGTLHTSLPQPLPFGFGGKVREHAIVHASATHMRS